MEKLKPCPFCGHTPTISQTSHGYGTDGGRNVYFADFSVKCESCGIGFSAQSTFTLTENRLEYIQDGLQMCVDRWNQRAPADE